MTEKLIKQILLAKPQDETVEGWLVKELTRLEKIKTSLRKLEQDNNIAKNNLKIILDDIEKKVREVRNSCPHYIASYFGDPSGGNDSFHRCDTCGYEY